MKKQLINIFLSTFFGFIGAYIFYISPIAQTQNINHSDVLPNNISFTNHTNKDSFIEAKGNVNRHIDISEVSDFKLASENSMESVVYIKTVSGSDYERYSWFDLFFNGRANERKVVGSGSGVIFTTDGYIVTNNHVIEGSDNIEVIHNKKTYNAKIIGTDPSTDLALLKVEATNLPAIKIGSSTNIQVGEWVLAVGNPFNLESTATAGIVSAKGRRINILEDIFPIESFIQTDAAINPGNSGGALVNKQGELVGINTAILSKTGSYAGYGFAVPSDIVVKVVNDLKEYGEVQKAFLGAEIVDLNEKISGQLKLDNLDGVVVASITNSGAANRAGIEVGDVIKEINDIQIKSKSNFDEQISNYSPGDVIKVVYSRENKQLSTEVTLTNIEGTTGIVKRNVFEANRLGATFEAIPKLEKQRLGIESGVRITEVERGLIYRMDLEEGYIVTKINNYQINDPEELAEILEKIRGRVIIEFVNKAGRKGAYSYAF